MTGPYWTDHDVTLYRGDAAAVLADLAPGSAQCVVTSPPYYGLRDDGTGRWEGGHPNCDHARQSSPSRRSSTLGGSADTQGGKAAFGGTCGKCGAVRVDQQYGLEPSPQEYVARMVGVFAEARRVLADDGVLWLNIGDSYSASAGVASSDGTTSSLHGGHHSRVSVSTAGMPTKRGIPAKNMLGVPWRLAFALQDDGWTLRNDVIWHKPNAMPESVTDRLSTRYEHVFLLTKSRRYRFNLDPIREPQQASTLERSRYSRGSSVKEIAGYGVNKVINPRTEQAAREKAIAGDGRNPGDVWQIATSPFPGAHFACMPPELARRCILAGSSEGDTVLDPFVGSGTAAKVARALGRRSVGIDLNADYLDLAVARIGDPVLEFDHDADTRAGGRDVEVVEVVSLFEGNL